MRSAASALAFACATLIGGCGPAPGYPTQAIARPTDVTDFATLYHQNCSACHGASGQNGPAIDLANPEYQALIDDATLRKWISGGMPGTEMPGFAQSSGGMLTDEQISAIVSGMRKTWARPTPSHAQLPSYMQTGPGDPHRGQGAYQAHCASCHQLQNQDITTSTYLTLVGDQALRTIIIAGRPDIGQPDWSHDGPGGNASTPLSEEDVADIVAYLGSLRTPVASNAATKNANQPAPQSFARPEE